MSNKPRQRLSVEERRAQLLSTGSELFASRPYDDVWIDDVAEQAGVSRGLLYHYFGNKRAFLHAVIEHETQEILAATTPDPEIAAAQQLRASIDGYLDYVAARPHGYRALFRGAVSADERVRELVDANLRRQEERLLQAVAGTRGDVDDERLRLAIHGWLRFLIAIVLDWLDRPTVERDVIADLATGTFGAMIAATHTARPPTLRPAPGDSP